MNAMWIKYRERGNWEKKLIKMLQKIFLSIRGVKYLFSSFPTPSLSDYSM